MTGWILVAFGVVLLLAGTKCDSACEARRCSSPTARPSLVRTTKWSYECLCMERPQ